MILQCMGGWCRERDRCAHYHAPQIRGRETVERLCGEMEEFEKVCATCGNTGQGLPSRLGDGVKGAANDKPVQHKVELSGVPAGLSNNHPAGGTSAATQG